MQALSLHCTNMTRVSLFNWDKTGGFLVFATQKLEIDRAVAINSHIVRPVLRICPDTPPSLDRPIFGPSRRPLFFLGAVPISKKPTNKTMKPCQGATFALVRHASRTRQPVGCDQCRVRAIQTQNIRTKITYPCCCGRRNTLLQKNHGGKRRKRGVCLNIVFCIPPMTHP